MDDSLNSRPDASPSRPTALLAGRRLPLVGGGLAVVAIAALLIWRAMGPPGPNADAGPVPDFADIQDVKARKQTFFEFLAPMIEARNAVVLDNRTFLARMRSAVADGRTPKGGDLKRLQRLADRYAVELDDGVTTAALDELLHRCDVIPPSLALAQAATESAWGTSRFAREGNNYFGEWCFTEGCGIVPSRRTAGKVHEVEAFDSVEDSVASYFRNLNRVGVYDRVRSLRAAARADGSPIDGEALAGGLQKYSERGQAYVKELRQVIRYNHLDRYDETLVASTGSSRAGG